VKVKRILLGRRRTVARLSSMAALGTLTLSAGAVAIAGQSNAAVAVPDHVAAIQQAWSFVPDYSASPALDTGTVRNSAGKAIAGATVVLFPYLIAPKAGTALTPLARTVAGPDGTFTIRLPDADRAELASKRSEGVLNVHIMAFYPGGIANWFEPIKPGASTALPARLTLRNAGTATATAATSSTPSAVGSNCSAIGNPKIRGGIPAQVGYKSSADSNLANTSFTYTDSASATEGVGISGTGPNGGFSAAGTVTQNTEGNGVFTNMPGAGSNDLNGSGSYVDQEYQCYIDRFEPPQDEWQFSPDVINSQYSTPGAKAVSAGYCNKTTANTEEKVYTSSQSTFSDGIQAEAIGLNINFSIQIGYATDSELIYTMGSAADPECGVGNYPNGAGDGEVVIHS
jgi:hypothetical protein